MKSQNSNRFLLHHSRRKEELKKARKNSSFFTGGSQTRFARPTSDKPGAFRGGRNGQGKPC